MWSKSLSTDHWATFAAANSPSGRTLKENKLVAVEDIMPVSARLIVNQAALKTKRAQVQVLIGALEKAARR